MRGVRLTNDQVCAAAVEPGGDPLVCWCQSLCDSGRHWWMAEAWFWLYAALVSTRPANPFVVLEEKKKHTQSTHAHTHTVHTYSCSLQQFWHSAVASAPLRSPAYSQMHGSGSENVVLNYKKIEIYNSTLIKDGNVFRDVENIIISV